jgi:DNA segregation ATPase FtsK/SpoIIIE, S-DNA-T family
VTAPDVETDEVRGEAVAGEVVVAPEHLPAVDLPKLPPRLLEAIERRREARRHPVIPETIRTRDARAALLADLAGYAWYLARFHGLRAPVYAARCAGRAPVGVWRIARVLLDVVGDAEPRPLMQAAVKRDDEAAYQRLAKLHMSRIRTRSAITAALLIALLVGGYFVARTLPPWLAWAAGAGVVAALGIYGQRKDRPIVSRAVDLPVQHVRLTSELIETALRNLGVPALSKGEIRFPAPIRDVANGWQATIDLPAGATPEQVMEKRIALASGLRRPPGCVWPDADHETHGGRLELTVLKVPMSKAKQRAYPYAKQGRADLFRSIPFGTDQRARPIDLPLIEANMLVGSLPGAGKTASVRCVLAGCALDPRAELHVWELKGSGDLESFERVSYRYGSGVDDETIFGCLLDLRWLLGELGRRAEMLKKLRKTARHLVPDSKVTSELASRRELGLHPIVFVIDEAQEVFSHDEYGAEAGDLATKIIKRGRALGVILLPATQRPDKDSLPTGVSANVSIRFCLRVMSQVENDMILGTSAYKNGIRATTLTRSDRGIGYLVGATDVPVVVRSYYLDAAATDRIVERARAIREAEGWLTGHAAGEDEVTMPTHNLAEDVQTVFATAERVWLWSEDIVERLARLNPEMYRGWDVEILARHLKSIGVETRQLNRVGPDGKRANRRGIELEQLREALVGHRREQLTAGASS